MFIEPIVNLNPEETEEMTKKRQQQITWSRLYFIFTLNIYTRASIRFTTCAVTLRNRLPKVSFSFFQKQNEEEIPSSLSFNFVVVAVVVIVICVALNSQR